ncbi:hypothetical protein BDZ89DRAFT_1164931 [Hymenopellis radicata]|nr:hypothetical protein BDZ89DRAFT_1164931 [Hymenopellis radicata]
MDTLPIELVRAIVHLGRPHDQTVWLRVSKRLSDITTPLLYKNVFLNVQKSNAAASLRLAITGTYKEMAPKILSFRVISLAVSKTLPGSLPWADMAFVVSRFPNLRILQLHSSSPSDWVSHLQNASFSNLHTLTVVYASKTSRIQPLSKFITRHPRLKNLSIQCPTITSAELALQQHSHLTVPALHSLEYAALPWHFVQGIVGSLKELRSAALDFGPGGTAEIETVVLALKTSAVAKRLQNLVCIKQRTYDSLLDYISSQLGGIESLTIHCDAPEVFHQFAYLERMKKLKKFTLISTATWIAKERAKINAISDEALLSLPLALQELNLYTLTWTREGNVWNRRLAA